MTDGQSVGGKLSQSERSALTRRRVVEATVDCLDRYGYASTSTTLIVEHAGISRGALLHQFPTKADIMAAVLESVFADHLAFYQRAFAGIADPRQRLLSLVRAAWEVFRGPGAVAQMEIYLAARSDPELSAAVARVRGRTDAYAEERFEELARAAGLTDTATIRGLFGTCVCTLRGLRMQWISAPEKAPVEETLTVLEATVSLALRTASP